MARYLPLFAIQVEHEFFAESHTMDNLALEFMPDKASTAMMQRENLLLRRCAKGIEIWQESRYEVIGLELGKTPNFDENKQNLNQSISTSSNSHSQRSSSTSSSPRTSSFSKNLRNQINPLNSQHPSKEIILNPLSSSPNISNSPRNSNQNNNS